ncbi:hypothetical protein Btru_051391 [Bulinus truncatus]|nr:hypothetical protein Btru_051391 [Bulinus truncatus]
MAMATGNKDIINESTANEIVSTLAVIIEALSVLGIFINATNFIIFYKLGLRSTTNIAFLALSFADLFNLLVVELGLIFLHPYFTMILPYPIIPMEISNFAAAPHPCIARVRSWIYVFLTAERCLCIALPLKVKQVITPLRTSVTMVAIYLFNIAIALPLYADMYVDWKKDAATNRTLLGVKYRYDRSYIKAPVNMAYALAMFTSFPMIILFTLILIWKLQRISHWRVKSVKSTYGSDAGLKRDKMVIRLVMVIACVLIVSLSPSMVYFMLTSVSIDFDTGKCKRRVCVLNLYGVETIKTTRIHVNPILCTHMVVNHAEVKDLRNENPYMRIIISIQNKNFTDFVKMYTTDSLRQNFIRTIIYFLRLRGFDGVKIDVQPTEGGDKHKFTQLFRDFLAFYVATRGVSKDLINVGLALMGVRYTRSNNQSEYFRNVVPVQYGTSCIVRNLAANDYPVELERGRAVDFYKVNGVYLKKIFYDDPETLRYKVGYITGIGYGGVLLYSVREDDGWNKCKQGQFPLLTAVYEECSFLTSALSDPLIVNVQMYRFQASSGRIDEYPPLCRVI